MRIHKNAWIWCHPDGRYGWTCAFRRGWKGSVYQMHPVSVCKDGLAAPRGCNVLYTQHEELAPCVCVCSTSIEQTKVKAAALFIMWHTMVFIHSFFMYCCHSFTDYCVFPFFFTSDKQKLHRKCPLALLILFSWCAVPISYYSGYTWYNRCNLRKLFLDYKNMWFSSVWVHAGGGRWYKHTTQCVKRTPPS